MTPQTFSAVPVSLAGKLQLPSTDRDVLDTWLKAMAGKRVDVEMRPHRKKRSVDQNAWHWVEAVPKIALAVGYERHDRDGHEQVHYALVAKCFGTTWNEQLKQDVPNVRSSHLTTEQFSELMEWEARIAAIEFGVVLVMPDEWKER